MSIPVLTQVYDEVRRLSIAGSVVASGDFRLKKLIAPLEQSGQKAPVFAKVAQAVTKVVESSDRNSAEALLELSTLVNAVLYTQGETGAAGTLEDIKTTSLGQQQTQTSARVLKPLLEALTTKGSGRLEIIREAQERGAFKDLRLISPALAALDDVFPEIADLIAENVLPIFGKAILPELRDKIDLKGRGGHVRRLQLMHELDPAGTREYVKLALDEGSKEMRVQAIECLGDDPEDAVLLAEHSKSKSKDVRTAALRALGKSTTAEVVQILSKAIAGPDLEIAVLPVQANRSAELLDVLLKTADKEMKALLEGKEKDKAQLSNAVLRVLSLLECLRGRDDKATEAFLIQTFGQRAKLAAIKGDHGGGDIFERVVSLMGSSSKKALALLVETHKSLSGNDLVQAFFGACRTKKPAEVFDVFGPYLAVKVDEKKKKKDPAAEKRESIAQAILVGDHSAYSYRMARRYYGGHDVDEHQKILAQLDPRWLDVAIEIGHVDLVSLLAKPGNVAAGNVLMKSFEEGLAKKSIHDFMNALVALVRIQHPEAADAVIKTIVKHSKGTTYGLWWVGRLIPDLPKSTIPKFDAMLATLPEKRVDELLDFITQLKNKP